MKLCHKRIRKGTQYFQERNGKIQVRVCLLAFFFFPLFPERNNIFKCKRERITGEGELKGGEGKVDYRVKKFSLKL